MANPTVLTDAVIWYGGHDLSGASNEITMNAARQENPDSRFGDTVEAVYPGAITVGVEAKGFWDSALDGPQFTQLTAPSESWPFTICPDGADAGEAAYGIQAYSFNYSALEAQWGQSLPYRLAAKSRSGGSLGHGKVILPKATYAINTSGTKHQVGAVSATQKIVAALHVFAIVGGSYVFTVFSDADTGAGGETSRIVFSAVTTAPSTQVVELAGPVTDTYWNASVGKTGGTSVTAALTLTIVDA